MFDAVAVGVGPAICVGGGVIVAAACSLGPAMAVLSACVVCVPLVALLAPADDLADVGTGADVVSPVPKCRGGRIPEMIKISASTAARVLTARTERRRV